LFLVLGQMMKTCLQYHEGTSYDRRKMAGHDLDWAHQPGVFKTYPGIVPIPLAGKVTLPERRLWSLFSRQGMKAPTGDMDLEKLSQILLLSYSFTAKARYPGGDFHFRSAASAGALYPTEIYLASNGVKGLNDGLYHFAIQHHALIPLRNQNLSSCLLEVTKAEGTGTPPVWFLLTAIFFRSAWKYGARSYRYHLLDTGHVIENLALALKALNLPFRLTYDFDDERVNHLLGVDPTREVALAVVHIPGSNAAPRETPESLPGLSRETMAASRVSRKEVDYQAVREIHSGGMRIPSSAADPPEMSRHLGLNVPAWERIEEPSGEFEVMGYSEALFRRRSKRNFIDEPVPRTAMDALLTALGPRDLPKGIGEPSAEQSLSAGFLAAHAEGMEPGFYLLNLARGLLGKVKPGAFTEAMAGICLDQAWLASAGVHFLFLTNLDILDRAQGPRGYRYATMAAGRLGQRLYLAATAMGLGCCGIGALYDREAAELLGLNHTSGLLYLVAVGRVRRP
jgi:SagB-type dehydrogenase family enzyme